ncbi:hypothetical protein NBRC116592_03700 [Colwellia sp. KU-HH00111]|uniref:CPCC family cysteine-rich protein n=1 Tax=Colwellia sp. KU-HH00111 TaxID=3127652 RepID=UPI003108D776
MSTTEELFSCPCCHYLSLSQRDKYEICEVCFWEDDGVQHPEDYSMPNHMFLGQGQDNFLKIGGCDEHGASLVKKDAKLLYKKQDHSALSMSTTAVHENPFVDFLRKIKSKDNKED